MKLKGYEIVRELNRGPITTVYLARQTALERPVLIKLLNSQWQSEADLVERFRREAIICARLRHNNIVSIFDVGTQTDNLYLVIEYIAGENLEEFIKRFQPVPFPYITYISREILRGLAYAHSRQIVHRDIKPGNILISDDGGVKIADFGLARSEDLPTITVQGGTVGTPAYMSPEQALGKKVDSRSDLFSLGATLYQLATGRSPFEGKNFAESIQRVLKETPAPLSQVRPDAPSWFTDLVGQMLNKNPEKRPAGAKDILKQAAYQRMAVEAGDLAAFRRAPQSPKPSRENSVAVPARPARKGLRPVLLTSAFFSVLLVLFLAFGLDWRSKPAGEDSGNPAPSGLAVAKDTLNAGSTVPSSGGQDSLPVDKTTDLTAQKADSRKAAGNRSPLQKEPALAGKKPAARPTEGQPAERSAGTSGFTPNVRPVELPEPVAPQPGGVYVSCTPWADIFINGEKRETTPLLKALELPAGRYNLELRNPNFESFRRELLISAGKIDSISVKLLPRAGFLELQVTPWARVYIDGRYLETTPLSKPLTLTAGMHRLRLSNPNFPDYIDSLQVAPGETLRKQISLQK